MKPCVPPDGRGVTGMKKITVITHSSTYESRAEAAGEFFRSRGYEVTCIFSDFDHLRKKTRKREEPGHVYVHMTPYTVNLSPKRLFSIRRFALDVKKEIVGRIRTGERPDLIYCMIPANTLAQMMAELHAEYGIPVLFDIIVLWPESLPLKQISSLPPVRHWRELRDKNLSCADMIFTECGLYREELGLPEEKSRTLYWFKDMSPVSGNAEHIPEAPEKVMTAGKPDAGVMEIAYMGAINNIIDMDTITSLLSCAGRLRPLHLRVIGEGDHREDFLGALNRAGVPFTWYGAVYDEDEKRRLLAPCSFGLNIMKESVHVGLTMKSIDYLSFGLPLINSIGGDTRTLVEKERIGINVNRSDLHETAEEMCRMADDGGAEARTQDVFSRYFTRDSFNRTLEEALCRVDGL